MKVFELYNHVALLGFENSLESDDVFYNALDRALLQVGAIRPAVGSCVINHQPITNLIADDTFTPKIIDNEYIIQGMGAKSFYFEADGDGVCYVEYYDAANDSWQTIKTIPIVSMARRFIAYKGVIKIGQNFVQPHQLIRLRFTGAFRYSIKNMALYNAIYSAADKDVPDYASALRYDISEMVDDFIGLSVPPISEADGVRLNTDYDVENGRVILLKRALTGTYKVLYKKRPLMVDRTKDADKSEEFIPLDDDLCMILPLLVAGYCWIEDDPEKSEYYMNLYRERAKDISDREQDIAPVRILNINGW